MNIKKFKQLVEKHRNEDYYDSKLYIIYDTKSQILVTDTIKDTIENYSTVEDFDEGTLKGKTEAEVISAVESICKDICIFRDKNEVLSFMSTTIDSLTNAKTNNKSQRILLNKLKIIPKLLNNLINIRMIV